MISLRKLAAIVLLTASTLLQPVCFTARVAAQTPSGAAMPDLSPALAAIEKRIDERRAELGIPGASLVIVKDGKVIYIKGLGYKDYEKKRPVTPDTLFAIGSSTKAFTAAAVMLAVDEGKVSLDDSPKKLLPYFKMSDPETDAKITVRDLLSHSSGLNRTDLAMVTGKLTREELIRVVAQVKPTAKLREKFQYQNIMFSAAGEIAGRAFSTTWENLVTTRILRPLGMNQTTVDVKTMQAARDFSYGYNYNAVTKETARLPMRDIHDSAAAGAINSNATDMAKWLEFMLADGQAGGKRLLSEASFTQITSPQMKVGGNVSYGLGWFIHPWKGHTVIEHGGNIDGFNAEVAFMPDQHLGFVLLTNITSSPLSTEAQNIVWSNLVQTPETPVTGNTGASPAVSDIAGTYKVEIGGQTLEFGVTRKDDSFILSVPGQPDYPLQLLTGSRYKLAAPAPDGFFATFRPAKDKPTETELFLEQPQGNIVLRRTGAVPTATSTPVSTGSTTVDAQLRELVGNYAPALRPDILVTIEEKDSIVTFNIPGQPAYPLRRKRTDAYAVGNLPDTYTLVVKRAADGAVTAVASQQPEGEFQFNRLTTGPKKDAKEILAKCVDAMGYAVLKTHKSMTATLDVDFIHQGVKAKGIVNSAAPGRSAKLFTFFALGKQIGTARDYFDGTQGGTELSFAPAQSLAGKQLVQARVDSDFLGLSNWATLFQTVDYVDTRKVGEEDAFVIKLTPEGGSSETYYISTKSYLILKHDSVEVQNDVSETSLPYSEVFSDYRKVEGLMLPFKTVATTIPMGDIVSSITSVKFDAPVDESLFRKVGPKKAKAAGR